MLNNNADISEIWAVPGPEVLERSLSVVNLINLLRNILRSYNIYFEVILYYLKKIASYQKLKL